MLAPKIGDEEIRVKNWLKYQKDPVETLISIAHAAGLYDSLVCLLFRNPIHDPDKAAKIERRTQFVHVWARCPELRKDKTIGDFIKEVEEAINKD